MVRGTSVNGNGLAAKGATGTKGRHGRKIAGRESNVKYFVS
jgi:hypothetical protein